MIDRVKEFIDSQGISVSAFEQKIHASDGMIRRAIKNGTDIQSKWIGSISDNYPEINLDWLITGKGEMIKPQTKSILKDSQEKAAVALAADYGIPLIPLDAVAGFGEENSSAIIEFECEKYVVPDFKGAEFLIQVKGSSMYPKYSSGDIVACKKLPLDTFFQWNKVYVIDSEQGVLIKRVKPGTYDEHITLVSENEKYDPFQIAISEIRSLAIVIGVIRLE